MYQKPTYTFVKTLPTTSMGETYNKVYIFDAVKTGLCRGTSLIVASTLAELVTGLVLNLILYMDGKKHSGMWRVDVRLYLTLTALAMPAGLVITDSASNINTAVYTPCGSSGWLLRVTDCYVSDCYKPQSTESGVSLNLGQLSWSDVLLFHTPSRMGMAGTGSLLRC